MTADRAYSPGFFASTDRGASLLYFTAAVPAIGFVHGPGDVNSFNEAMLEATQRAASRTTGRDSTRSLAEEV
jgi:hypothetical protein